jgi:ribosomal-protein-alanine N-acetyltransferase|tara:strand:- start:551 stop:1060 length:510 start_codon:yes stop_codon:yes gene_type:complete
MMIVETNNLLLREMTEGDFCPLYKIFSDAETMAYYPAPFDEDQVKAWISWNLDNYATYNYGLWTLVKKNTGEVIGDCGLINQTVEGIEEIEVGYHVNKKFWGKGYATEAAIACRDYAFSNLGFSKVISLIRPENVASRKVAEKNGMKIEKEIMKSGFNHYVYACSQELA